jgi:hypothetical protein
MRRPSLLPANKLSACHSKKETHDGMPYPKEGGATIFALAELLVSQAGLEPFVSDVEPPPEVDDSRSVQLSKYRMLPLVRLLAKTAGRFESAGESTIRAFVPVKSPVFRVFQQ